VTDYYARRNLYLLYVCVGLMSPWRSTLKQNVAVSSSGWQWDDDDVR